MSSLDFPDAMFDLRYWLRNHPVLNPLHGGRVFFRLPDNPQAPMMRISRAGGAVQTNSEVPIQDLSVLIESWATDSRLYETIRKLTIALEHACHTAEPGTLINPSGNTVLHNARIPTSFDSPDPDTGWPRIVTSVIFTVTASQPTVV